MKLLIFGATGETGRRLVEQGLGEGHHITVFVRNPAALNIKHDNLVVVKGELSDRQTMATTAKGKDGVISVLGNKTSTALRQKNTVISEGLKNIIAAMKEGDASRIVFVTSFGVSKNVFLPEKLFIKVFLRNIFADIPLQEKLLRESNLQWTIVRPARLINGARTSLYRSGEDLPIGLFSKISRADVADFLLNNVQNADTIGKVIMISY